MSTNDRLTPATAHLGTGGCRTPAWRQTPAARPGRRGRRPPVAQARRAAQGLQPDPAVLALLDTLSRDAPLADLATLAAHPTRRSDSAGFDEAATCAAGRLEEGRVRGHEPRPCRAAAAGAGT